MVTDPIPKQSARRAAYQSSDALYTLELPAAEPLRVVASRIETALTDEDRALIGRCCGELAELVSSGFSAPTPPVQILGVRPHRVQKGVCVYQKFGDYDLRTSVIRLWMRTAIRHQITTYGTLLSTLCHELCHHLDVARFGFASTPHTRGFYERAAALYHHVRGTPSRRLVWVRLRNGMMRIDWGKTMRG